MPLHIEKLLLTAVDLEEPNTAQAILLMAQNYYLSAGILQQVENALGSKEAFMTFLRTLDAKHLYGQGIYELMVGKFKGDFGNKMFDYVYEELICQVCGERVVFESLMDDYEALISSQHFFARKFTSGLRLSTPAIDHFGTGELKDIFNIKKTFEPHWQLNVHTFSKVPSVFHRFIQPELPPVSQDMIMMANEEDDHSLKTRHGTVVRKSR